MSHFPVMVTVNPPQATPFTVRGVQIATVSRNAAAQTEQDLEALVAPLLAKYDENLEVPPYQRECWCVGLEARRRIGERAREMVGGPPGTLTQDDNDAWVAWEKRFDDTRAELMAADPETQKPDPDCTDCKGLGQTTTTFNPLAKWDWYVVGGRWNDLYPGNVQPVSALLQRTDDDWICPALVDPKGDWHAKGRMRMFALMTDRKTDAEWHDEVRGVLAQHPQAMVVIVDAHI